MDEHDNGSYTVGFTDPLALVVSTLMLALPAFATDTVYYYLSDSLHSEVVVTDAHRNVVG